MVERARKMAHFRLVILDGRAYIEEYRPALQTRDVFTLWGILRLLRRYPGRLPDLELMFDCDDWPLIQMKDYRRPKSGPPPLFRYCGDGKTLDIVFPDWSFWGCYKIYIDGWAWSVSEKYILACDAMTLFVRPNYYDFFTRGMAKIIANGGSHFIFNELKMGYVYDYMYHVLSEYARLLTYKPSIPPKAVEVCSQAMACPSNGTSEKGGSEKKAHSHLASGDDGE
ncbi:hypothetical protein NL676_011622 [Syzygium grande]|nr:hypothetical protein NL676_011622 [Syzygium grande]